MTQKIYLAGLIGGSILGLSSFFMAIFSVSPQGAGGALFLLIFVSLFVALACLLTLAGFFLLKKFKKINFNFLIGLALMQGILWAAVLTLLIFLASKKLFFWWVGILLIAALAAGQVFIFKKETLWKI